MPETIDRLALADFLRRRREAVSPAEVGLRAGPRRRTAGLRREEVAHLAGLSVDYVVRLEQARSSTPSDQVLAALDRALRLSEDERDHLYLLAGSRPPARGARHPHVRRAVLHLLDAIADAGVFVTSDLGHLLAANPLAVSLLGRSPGGTTREDSALAVVHRPGRARPRTGAGPGAGQPGVGGRPARSLGPPLR